MAAHDTRPTPDGPGGAQSVGNGTIGWTAYANHLAAPLPDRRRFSAPWIVLGLLIACTLIPRLFMAVRVDALCPDGALYLRMAQAVDRGELTGALELKFNLYPFLLAGMHRLGVPWDETGKVWGVLASTLVVLPLFGWVRRQFDDRVAIVSCLLYAFHSELIEWAPETVRDPTFWLFFTAALYASWRAATEVRVRWYLAAAAAILLAVCTRFEGVVLVIPLLLWSLGRWCCLRQQRWKLVAGLAAAVVVLPMLLLTIKLALFSPIAMDRFVPDGPWQRVQGWVASWSAGPSEAVATPLVKDQSALALGWGWLRAVERGLNPVFGLLLLAGFAWRWRLFNRWDHLPPTVVVGAILLGIYVHVWWSGVASSRYALVIAIMSARCPALALLDWSDWLRHRLCTWQAPPALCRATLAVPLVAFAMFGVVESQTSSLEGRMHRAQLGRWIRSRYGDAQIVVGNDVHLSLVSYYAHGNYGFLPPGLQGRQLVDAVASHRPAVVLLSRRGQIDLTGDTLVKLADELGLERIPSGELPDLPPELVVLARQVPHH